MLCKKCGCVMRIQRAWYSVTGDDSPQAETALYSNAELCCVNPKCPEKGKKTVTSTRVELAGGKTKGE